MALDDEKHVLNNECEYLGVPKDAKYPFRLVFFEKDQVTGTYKASTTPQSWPSMGFALRGLLPKLEEKGPLIPDPLEPLWRRNSFFGIINAEEALQPHIFNLNEIEGVEVCEEGGKIFMQKGRLLRLPLKAIFPPIRDCQCNCGNAYDVGLTFYFNDVQVTGQNVPSFMSGPASMAYFQEWKGTCQIFSRTVGPYPNPAPPFFRTDFYNVSFCAVLGIYTPQHTPVCSFAEPSIFEHPRCSGFEMMEFKIFGYGGTQIIYESLILPFPGLVRHIDSATLNPVQTGGRIGIACNNKFATLGISDEIVNTWQHAERIALPSIPIPDKPDKPDEWPEGAPFPTSDDFDPFKLEVEVKLGPPTSGIYSQCPPALPCNCPISFPHVPNPCLE